jgi:hypothetical protein
VGFLPCGKNYFTCLLLVLWKYQGNDFYQAPETYLKQERTLITFPKNNKNKGNIKRKEYLK